MGKETLVSGTQAVQEPEQSAEETYVLNEDGEVEIKEVSSGEQETGEAKQEEAQPQKNYYSPEEIEKIGIDKLDPNRLPPELVPFYKSMQADYTRKTQAVAEERKLIERLLDKALSHPEVAKEFMNDPDLVAAAQRYPQLAQKLQAVSQMAQPQAVSPIKQLTEMAKKAVEQELGEEFDEFNPEHMAALTLKVQEIQQQMAQQQAVISRIQQLQTSEPHFAEIDEYAQQKLMEMSYAEAQKILSDFDALIKFWEDARKEWYDKRLNQNQQPQTQPQNPPQVETAGAQKVETKPSFNPEMLAEMDDDEIAQFLVKQGLV